MCGRAASKGEKIMDKNTAKKGRADLVLILFLLLISFLLLLVLRACSDDGAFVRVSVNGEVVGEYSLSVDGEYSLNGGTNVLVIKDGEAYVSEANCPDRLCMDQGKISVSGERIICLPNKIEIVVVGDGEELIQ